MTDERILSAKPRGDESSIETTLRPRRLAEYIGQDKVKENLRIALAAAQKRYIRFVVFAAHTKKWFLRRLLHLARVIPIDSSSGPRASKS